MIQHKHTHVRTHTRFKWALKDQACSRSTSIDGNDGIDGRLGEAFTTAGVARHSRQRDNQHHINFLYIQPTHQEAPAYARIHEATSAARAHLVTFAYANLTSTPIQNLADLKFHTGVKVEIAYECRVNQMHACRTARPHQDEPAYARRHGARSDAVSEARVFLVERPLCAVLLSPLSALMKHLVSGGGVKDSRLEWAM